jgi:hypothetical protein
LGQICKHLTVVKPIFTVVKFHPKSISDNISVIM